MICIERVNKCSKSSHRANLRQKRGTLQPLRLEDRHDRFNDFVVSIGGLLILQNVEKGVDSDRLVVIVRPRADTRGVPRRSTDEVGVRQFGSRGFIIWLSLPRAISMEPNNTAMCALALRL